MKKVIRRSCVILFVSLVFLLFAQSTWAANASIKLNKKTATVFTGEKITLKASVKGSSKKVKWSSSNKKIATVRSGVVTGKKAGTVIIKATANGKTAKCKVKVKATTIRLNRKTAWMIAGKTLKLKATVTGKSKKVTWTSSNKSVATVKNGKVTAKKAGTVTITAKANKQTAKCKITVEAPASIKLNKKEAAIDVGGTLSLKATVTGTSDQVKWSTSDSSVAIVENGKVTGVGEGSAVITAKVNGLKATCTVTVNAEEEAPVQAVSAGCSYTAILKADGTLWTCGWNASGQLGNGKTLTMEAHVTTPEKVMSGVKAVSAGWRHTGIVKTDGSLWMCGMKADGVLGEGSTQGGTSTPVKIMSGVEAVSAGSFHTAILKSDGTLWMCGQNNYGQLGDGTTENRLTPVKIMSGVKAVSAGGSHTAILKTDGSLWMCGANYNGQLGDETIEYGCSDPVQIMSGVEAVSADRSDSTAILKNDGTLWMCGRNDDGELGDGTTEKRLTPEKIMSGVKAVSISEDHTAILKTDGSLWMCGGNYYGALGDGTREGRKEPVKVM